MPRSEFFEAPEEQSAIKSRIVRDYFKAWAKVMLGRAGGRLAYVDLFSGPGRYADGSPSTPILVLEAAIQHQRLRETLVSRFNDNNPTFASELRKTIGQLPGIEKLRNAPVVTSATVNRDVVEHLRLGQSVPTLFFIDPFGYRGLSLELISASIKNWGCDCIFFFNYNRINPAINNPAVLEHMNDLFGPERASKLRGDVGALSPDSRQATIIDSLTESLRSVGGRYVLLFEFQSQHGDRTSHYVVFVSKAFIGYHIMKEVMAKLSTDSAPVSQFHYVPVRSTQMALFPEFGRSHSIATLKHVLVHRAAGITAAVWDIYEQFTPDSPYTLKNVKDALIALEEEGALRIVPPASQRPRRHGKITLNEDKRVTFPPSKGGPDVSQFRD